MTQIPHIRFWGCLVLMISVCRLGARDLIRTPAQLQHFRRPCSFSCLLRLMCSPMWIAVVASDRISSLRQGAWSTFKCRETVWTTASVASVCTSSAADEACPMVCVFFLFCFPWHRADTKEHDTIHVRFFFFLSISLSLSLAPSRLVAFPSGRLYAGDCWHCTRVHKSDRGVPGQADGRTGRASRAQQGVCVCVCLQGALGSRPVPQTVLDDIRQQL